MAKTRPPTTREAANHTWPVKPLPSPFDDIAAGRAARISVGGAALLGSRLLTKDLAFPSDERVAFQLGGLLPARVLTIEEQVALELEHLRVKTDPLEQYIGLAALQDRNATLFYRLLSDHLEEFLPIVYTPTVGRACQEFSHIIRRTRGTWITPADVDRIPELLRHGPFEDVRLVVVTDNERILGLGDQGAGGMAIPIGKLALYTAACGIHPSLTLPVSLDVGTDNPGLLADPLYLGYRAPRLRGAEYDALIEAFVSGVQEVWPGCLIQFEDFKQHNALRLLERYRDRVPSFNDDISGTAAVVVAGVLSGLRATGRPIADARVLLVGAGAAGVGIGRLLRLAMLEAGLPDDVVRDAIALVDTHGLVHAGRSDLDASKSTLAVAAVTGATPDLVETIRLRRPTILVGTTGVAGTFTETVIREMDERVHPDDRPIVLPLSNPTSAAEATPAEILAWTGGRAIVATGSPFEAVDVDGRLHEVGQANNVFVFPGVGLGAIVAESRAVTDRMFLLAARALAAEVSDERLAVGALYPPVGALRSVARRIAIVVAREAVAAGLSAAAERGPFDPESEVDAAMWQPEYVPYTPARFQERRKQAEA